MPDDLERRATIAAHDAACSDRCDITVMPSLNKREQAIVKRWRADVERAEIAEAEVRALADVSSWHVYESRDTGDVYVADAVRDRMADIRAALDRTEATNGTR